MNLSLYSGLELPTYSEDEVAWTSREIKTAARSRRPDFVRRACLEYNGEETDLRRVLTLADFVLDTVCDELSVYRVGYSWGLAPISKANRDRLGEYYHQNDHELLPADFALVACVKKVPGAQPLSQYWKDRIKSAGPSSISVQADDGRYVTNYDLRPSQFVQLPPQEEFGLEGAAILVDMEPRLLVRRSLEPNC